MPAQRHMDEYDVFVNNGLFRAGFDPFSDLCTLHAHVTTRMYRGWRAAADRGFLYELSSCDDFSQAGGKPGLWLRTRRNV